MSLLRSPRVWFLLLVLSVTAVMCLAYVAWQVGNVLSKPQRRTSIAPPDWPVTVLSLSTDTGGVVKGWLAVGAPGQGAVLLLHGVHADRLSMLERARSLHRLGYTVLLLDLPGHGESSGERITFGLAEGAGVRAAMAYLRSELPAEKIGVIGSSLGGAALLLAQLLRPADAAVLEAVCPSIEAAVDNRVRVRIGPLARLATPLLLWQLPWRLGIEPAQLRPVDRMARLAAPVLVVGGMLDRHTPPAETRQLFDAANEPKTLWLVEGAAHEDLHAFAPRAYEEKVFGFLARHLRR